MLIYVNIRDSIGCFMFTDQVRKQGFHPWSLRLEFHSHDVVYNLCNINDKTIILVNEVKDTGLINVKST